jgi:autotransporter-associated beta strand protein
MLDVRHRKLLWAIGLASGLTSVADGAALDSSNLQLSITTGPNQFSFQIVNTATNTTVLSSSSTSFGSAAVTGASVASSGSNFVNLNFSLAGGGTATGNFTLISPTQVRVNLTGTPVTEAAGTGGSPYATPTISQMFADQGGETYYGTFSPTYSGNGLQNNSATAGATETLADNGTFTGSNNNANSEGARAPFYFTSNNVGIYTPTVNVGTYTFGNGSSGKTGFTFNATDGTVQNTTPSLSYTVMVGNSPKDVLGQFRGVAGPAFMPPPSAFDPYFWRDDDHQFTTSQSGAANSQQEVMDDANKLLALKIAASGIEIDRPYGSNDAGQNGDVSGWGDMNFDPSSTGFPTPLAMISQLKSMGLNTYLWAANRANENLLTVANNNSNYLLPVTTGSGVTSPAYNLLNPAAYASFKSQLSQLITDGVVGFKIDRGGEGEMPVAMQNEIPVLFDQLAAAAGAAQNGSNFFDISRDPNDQARQSTAVWAGDSISSFAGLSTTVQEGLRAGLIGFPMWGSDTGGYLGSPSEDLFARWTEFSAYCPVMEVLQGAGSANTGGTTNGGNVNRDIWYDYAIPGGSASSSPLVGIVQNQTAVHHDLIPYVQSCMAESMQDGMPIMRAMFLEFPNDPKVTNMTSEYMYGPSILVAPVTAAATTVTAGTTNAAVSTSGQSVYLPLGTRWVEYDETLKSLANGQQTITTSAPLTVYAGGTTLNLTVAEGTIPTYAREGAIIPRGDILQDNLTTSTSDPNWAPSLHIDFFPSNRLTSSFNYYTSSATIQTIQSSISNQVLQTTFGDLGVSGTMDIYMGRFFSFNGFSSISMNGQTLGANGYTFDSSDDVLAVPFTGAVNLDVNLVLPVQPAGLLWDGHASNSWDTASLNFTNGTAAFSNGTAVTFGDFAADGATPVQNTNIIIAGGGVQPSLVTFTNSTATYQFTDADTANGIGDSGGTPTSVTISGGGTVIFSSPNSYSGGTSISAGSTLSVASDAALGSVPGAPATNITLNNGTLQVTATTAFNTPTISTNRNISLGSSGGTINVTAVATGNFSSNETAVQYCGAMTGPGDLTVTGGNATNTGTAPYLLELAPGINTYAGNTFINNATVAQESSLSGGNVLPPSTVLNLNNNGWFLLNGTGNQTVAGLNGDSTSFVATDNSNDAVSLIINPASNQTYTFSGTIGAQNVLNKTGNNSVMSVLINGPGTQVFSGNNSYGGGTTITSGTLAVSSAGTNPLGGGTITIGSAGTFNYTGGGASFANAFAGSGNVTTATEFNPSGDWSAFSGTLTDSGGLTTFGANSTSGNASYVLNATGVNVLAFGSGLTSSYTASLGALSTGPNGDGGTVVRTSVNFTGATVTVAIGNLNTNTTFAGVFQDHGTSTLAVSKVGTGSLTLTGNSAYSAGTTVGGGTLFVNNTAGSGTGSGPVSVSGGAVLSGSGTASGAVTLAAGTSNGSPGVLANGGTITAGATSTTVGTLTTGNQTWKRQANLVAKVNSITGNNPIAGTDNDLVTTAGSITLSDTKSTPFNVQLLAPAAGVVNFHEAGSSYTFKIASFGSFAVPTGFTYDPSHTTILATDGGVTAPTLTAADVSDEGFFTLDTSSFADASSNHTNSSNSSFALELISNGGGAGTLDVVYFSVTPEPSTTLLVLAGAAPLLMGRRRRMKDAASRSLWTEKSQCVTNSTPSESGYPQAACHCSEGSICRVSETQI